MVVPATGGHDQAAPAVTALALLALLVVGLARAQALPPVTPPPMPDGPVAPVPPPPALTIPEIVVTAEQPRYVAPTLRDRIGRIWAPVYINGQGPYRLVLDTGASMSAVVERVAAALALPPAARGTARLKGVTGTTSVPVVTATTLEVGDLYAEAEPLLVIEDAFGGADGVLAARSLERRRIHVEFRNDRIEIKASPRRRPTRGFATLPVRLLEGHVPYVEVTVGGVVAKAIIDTGAQQTTANLALRAALEARRRTRNPLDDAVVGVSGDIQDGRSAGVPPIDLGGVTVRNSRITFGDFYIYSEWELLTEPALMIGMDVWGVLDTMILDYRRQELQLRLRRGGSG